MPIFYKDWDRNLLFTCQAFIRTGIGTYYLHAKPLQGLEWELTIYMPSFYQDWDKNFLFACQAFIRTGIETY